MFFLSRYESCSVFGLVLIVSGVAVFQYDRVVNFGWAYFPFGESYNLKGLSCRKFLSSVLRLSMLDLGGLEKRLGLIDLFWI